MDAPMNSLPPRDPPNPDDSNGPNETAWNDGGTDDLQRERVQEVFDVALNRPEDERPADLAEACAVIRPCASARSG